MGPALVTSGLLICGKAVLQSSGTPAKRLATLCRDKDLMEDYTKDLRHKTGMKSLFGRKNQKKDGTDGKVSRLPDKPAAAALTCSLAAVHWTKCLW